MNIRRLYRVAGLLLIGIFFIITTGTALANPDVIVSTIGSTVQKYGTVNNVTAYAVTTVSCNLGTSQAIWIQGTNQHPVIAQNLYRFKVVNGAGRMEMIGMAWLKHGFCAADAPGPNCATCQNAGTCDWLGLGCTDTYGAGLNGSQGNLGPRSDVNAWTGAFNYPFPTQGQTGNAIYKRLQIRNDDLNPALNPGAGYLCEVQYICTDEQPAQRYNNVSWRPMLVGAFVDGGYNLSFTGSTMVQQSAIQAWPSYEPGVTLVNVNIPGDGRMILGYKVTEIVPGSLWHYEYALYNMNSDRCAQLVTVPAPGTATISNIEFHDVDYHSGEPYSNTDWAAGANEDGVTWLTQSFAQNPNANALRWGSTYNFRFDCDRPPYPGTVKVGLFKPGSPANMNVAALVPNPCVCPGDLTTNGTIDGQDISNMVQMMLGAMSGSPCADLASPYGTQPNTADAEALVELLIGGALCP